MANPRRIRHSRGVSYEITYRVKGRMVRQRFPDKDAALDALAKARLAIRAGTHRAPADSHTTLADYAEVWKLGLHVAPSTRDHYEMYLKNHVLPLLGDRPLVLLRRSDVVAFVAQLGDRGLAPATVRAVYNIVAMVCRSAMYDGLIATTPCFKISRPSIPPRTLAFLTPNKVRQLLQATKPAHYALIATAVGTGMRQGEVLGLALPNINFLRRELSVEQQLLTPMRGSVYITRRLKTPASRRTIPLPQFVIDALAAHVAGFGTGPDELLFTNPHGGPWRRGALNDSVWKPTLARAGLPTGLGFHSLRHTYASGLIRAGLHPRVIQARLGHKSIVETMDTYGHLFPDQDAETALALDQLFGGALRTRDDLTDGRGQLSTS